MKDIAIVIVAAGSSSRMKKAKQLLPLGESTMLELVMKQALAVPVKDVLVVLGANNQKVFSAIKHYPVTIVENKDWKNGLGSSISAGINFISNTFRTCKAVVILLGDQPLIDTSYIEEMIKLWNQYPSLPLATRYPDKNGVPAIFPCDFFEALSGLKGDSGARAILNGSTSVHAMDPGDKIKDVDTPQDYEEIRRRFT